MKNYKLKDGIQIVKLNCNVVVLSDKNNFATFDIEIENESGVYCELTKLIFLNNDYVMHLTDNEIDLTVIDYYIEEAKEPYYNHFRLNKPEHDEDYWYIDECGDAYRTNWYDDERDNQRWNKNNCFDSGETTETFKENNDRFAPLLKKMEVEFSKGGEIDWSKDDKKYCIYNDTRGDVINSFSGSMQYDIIYCNSLEIVENFVEQNYEELTAHHEWMQEYNNWKGQQ
jgi:hypothetical protein